MKNTTVAGLLRAALALWTAAVLTATAYFVPVFMRHICAVRPELAGRYGWGVAFGWLLAAMMLWAFLLLWRVMGTVAQGRAFVRKMPRASGGCGNCRWLVLRYARDWVFSWS